MTSNGRTKGWWLNAFLSFLLVVGVGWIIFDREQAQKDEETATGNAVSLAEQVRQACDDTSVPTADLGDLCNRAQDVVEEPNEPVKGEKGDPGEDGQDGRGITGATVTDGVLRLSYTDGSSRDVGRVQGQDGADGADGADGRSIVDAEVAGTALVLVFSDGSTETVGTVVGADGQDGEDGQPGADGATGQPGASAYQLAVSEGFQGTLTEWLASLVGPAGENGATGSPGADGEDGTDGREVEFRSTLTHFQWRYVGEPDDAWRNAFELDQLACPDGFGLAEREMDTDNDILTEPEIVAICVEAVP